MIDNVVPEKDLESTCQVLEKVLQVTDNFEQN